MVERKRGSLAAKRSKQRNNITRIRRRKSIYFPAPEIGARCCVIPRARREIVLLPRGWC
jgi:hypothetical protein